MSPWQTSFFNLAIDMGSSPMSFHIWCVVQSTPGKKGEHESVTSATFVPNLSLACSPPTDLDSWLIQVRPLWPCHIKMQPPTFTLSWLNFIQMPWLRYSHLFSVCHYEARDFFFPISFFAVFSASEIVTNTQEPSVWAIWWMDKPKGHPLPKMCVYVCMCAWPHACTPLGFTANQRISLARRSQGLWASGPALSSLAKYNLTWHFSARD